jgi:putative phosphoribosyl transferase
VARTFSHTGGSTRVVELEPATREDDMFRDALPPRVLSQRIMVPAGGAVLTPVVTLPTQPRGLVLIPSASGDRVYERVNGAVASALWEAGFVTVEVDLFTSQEAREDAETARYRYDMDLVAARMASILEWVHHTAPLHALEVGILAAGTCSAAALVAAAERPELIQSIVCRSARPELVPGVIAHVHAPVMLLLGERDIAHRDSHLETMIRLPASSRLEIVPNARHLLDRPEDIQRVASLAAAWFGDSLSSDWASAGCWRGPVREVSLR